MQTIKRIAPVLLAGYAALTAAVATAEVGDGRGWYVGGNLSHLDVEVEAGNSTFLDESGVGLGAYGGYNFNQWFGLDVAFFHSDNIADDRVDLRRSEIAVLSFAPKVTFNLGERVGLFVKAGPSFVQYSEEYDDYYYDDYYDDDYYEWDSDAEWDEILVGVGIGTDILLQGGIHMRLSYDYVSGTLEESWSSWDAPVNRLDVTIGRFALGIHYQF